jgi:hypothetical protein
MITLNAYLTELQNLYQEVRAARKDGEDVPIDTVKDWEIYIKRIDQVTRDRLFVLTVAAEKGWIVAADLVSEMRGTNTVYKSNFQF